MHGTYITIIDDQKEKILIIEKYIFNIYCAFVGQISLHSTKCTVPTTRINVKCV